MVGVSIPLSLKPAEERIYSRIAFRTGRLLLLGFVLSNLFWLSKFSGGSWRLFGVLQRIGLVYCACAFMFLTLGPRTRLIIAAAILVLYWPLTLLPSLDGLPNDIWLRGHNFVGSVDRVLLGAGNHIYVHGPDGYDPEGLLGTLTAVAQGLIGVSVGEYLLRSERSDRLRAFALAGGGMLVVGIAWGSIFPVVKDIWSSTFVLVTSGISLILLSLLGYAFDGRPSNILGNASEILVLPFGTNAIAAYTLARCWHGRCWVGTSSSCPTECFFLFWVLSSRHSLRYFCSSPSSGSACSIFGESAGSFAFDQPVTVSFALLRSTEFGPE